MKLFRGAINFVHKVCQVPRSILTGSTVCANVVNECLYFRGEGDSPSEIGAQGVNADALLM